MVDPSMTDPQVRAALRSAAAAATVGSTASFDAEMSRAHRLTFSDIPLTKTFQPTMAEFTHPLDYIEQIRAEATQYGIIKIKPPPEWRPEFSFPMKKQVTPKIQPLHLLMRRKDKGSLSQFNITELRRRFEKELQYFLRSESDLPTLCLAKTRVHYYDLFIKVIRLGGYDTLNGTGGWKKICEQLSVQSTAASHMVKSTYEVFLLRYEQTHVMFCFNPAYMMSETQSIGELFKQDLSQYHYLSATAVDSRSKLCRRCIEQISSSDLRMCQQCGDTYHNQCADSSDNSNDEGKIASVPSVGSTKSDELWLCSECQNKFNDRFGYDSSLECSAEEYRRKVELFRENFMRVYQLEDWNTSLPTSDERLKRIAKLEEYFWSILDNGSRLTFVEYASEIPSSKECSGFPQNHKMDPFHSGHEFNLMNISRAKGNILQEFLKRDISGMTYPWLYCGAFLTTFAWHSEDHYAYSVNYNHIGCPKLWYGVPGLESNRMECAMKSELPGLFEKQPDLLFHLVTHSNPLALIKKHKVPVFKAIQEAGEFVITFPQAYHGGFNLGFNVAEAVNFCNASWMSYATKCVTRYVGFGRRCAFSTDRLICEMVNRFESLDPNTQGWLFDNFVYLYISHYQFILRLLKQNITRGKPWAYDPSEFQLKNKLDLSAQRGSDADGTGRMRYDETEQGTQEETDAECCICSQALYCAIVRCNCDLTRVSCAEHFEAMCKCDKNKKWFEYNFNLTWFEQSLHKVMDLTPRPFDPFHVDLARREALNPDWPVRYHTRENLIILKESSEPDVLERLKLTPRMVRDEFLSKFANLLGEYTENLANKLDSKFRVRHSNDERWSASLTREERLNAHIRGHHNHHSKERKKEKKEKMKVSELRRLVHATECVGWADFGNVDLNLRLSAVRGYFPRLQSMANLVDILEKASQIQKVNDEWHEKRKFRRHWSEKAPAFKDTRLKINEVRSMYVKIEECRADVWNVIRPIELDRAITVYEATESCIRRLFIEIPRVFATQKHLSISQVSRMVFDLVSQTMELVPDLKRSMPWLIYSYVTFVSNHCDGLDITHDRSIVPRAPESSLSKRMASEIFRIEAERCLLIANLEWLLSMALQTTLASYNCDVLDQLKDAIYDARIVHNGMKDYVFKRQMLLTFKSFSEMISMCTDRNGMFDGLPLYDYTFRNFKHALNWRSQFDRILIMKYDTRKANNNGRLLILKPAVDMKFLQKMHEEYKALDLLDKRGSILKQILSDLKRATDQVCFLIESDSTEREKIEYLIEIERICSPDLEFIGSSSLSDNDDKKEQSAVNGEEQSDEAEMDLSPEMVRVTSESIRKLSLMTSMGQWLEKVEPYATRTKQIADVLDLVALVNEVRQDPNKKWWLDNSPYCTRVWNICNHMAQESSDLLIEIEEMLEVKVETEMDENDTGAQRGCESHSVQEYRVLLFQCQSANLSDEHESVKQLKSAISSMEEWVRKADEALSMLPITPTRSTSDSGSRKRVLSESVSTDSSAAAATLANGAMVSTVPSDSSAVLTPNQSTEDAQSSSEEQTDFQSKLRFCDVFQTKLLDFHDILELDPSRRIPVVDLVSKLDELVSDAEGVVKRTSVMKQTEQQRDDVKSAVRLCEEFISQVQRFLEDPKDSTEGDTSEKKITEDDGITLLSSCSSIRQIADTFLFHTDLQFTLYQFCWRLEATFLADRKAEDVDNRIDHLIELGPMIFHDSHNEERSLHTQICELFQECLRWENLLSEMNNGTTKIPINDFVWIIQNMERVSSLLGSLHLSASDNHQWTKAFCDRITQEINNAMALRNVYQNYLLLCSSKEFEKGLMSVDDLRTLQRHALGMLELLDFNVMCDDMESKVYYSLPMLDEINDRLKKYDESVDVVYRRIIPVTIDPPFAMKSEHSLSEANSMGSKRDHAFLYYLKESRKRHLRYLEGSNIVDGLRKHPHSVGLNHLREKWDQMSEKLKSKIENEGVYCYCYGSLFPEEEDRELLMKQVNFGMLECRQCHEWFHSRCLGGINVNELSPRAMGKFACGRCLFLSKNWSEMMVQSNVKDSGNGAHCNHRSSAADGYPSEPIQRSTCLQGTIDIGYVPWHKEPMLSLDQDLVPLIDQIKELPIKNDELLNALQSIVDCVKKWKENARKMLDCLSKYNAESLANELRSTPFRTSNTQSLFTGVRHLIDACEMLGVQCRELVILKCVRYCLDKDALIGVLKDKSGEIGKVPVINLTDSSTKRQKKSFWNANPKNRIREMSVLEFDLSLMDELIKKYNPKGVPIPAYLDVELPIEGSRLVQNEEDMKVDNTSDDPLTPGEITVEVMHVTDDAALPQTPAGDVSMDQQTISTVNETPGSQETSLELSAVLASPTQTDTSLTEDKLNLVRVSVMRLNKDLQRCRDDFSRYWVRFSFIRSIALFYHSMMTRKKKMRVTIGDILSVMDRVLPVDLQHSNPDLKVRADVLLTEEEEQTYRKSLNLPWMQYISRHGRIVKQDLTDSREVFTEKMKPYGRDIAELQSKSLIRFPSFFVLIQLVDALIDG